MSQDKIELSERVSKIIAFSERVPYSVKAANNFKWAKNRIDSLDVQCPDIFDDEYKNEVLDNYRLMSGLSMKHYSASAFRASMPDVAALITEGIDSPNLEIEHFDFYTPFLRTSWGDQRRAKLQFTVTDSSRSTQNYIKEYTTQNLRNHFETKLLTPIRQYALMMWQADNGIDDIFSLSPKERQEMVAQVNASVESLIPKDVANLMKNGMISPIERQGQALAEALAASLGLKYTIDEAYKHSFATDGVVFETGMRRLKPFIEWVDLLEFNTGGGKDIFINNNPWFKRVQYLHPSEIYNRFGDQFTKMDLHRLDKMNLSGERLDDTTYKDEKFVANIDFNGEMLLQKTDLKTKEGQELFSGIMEKYVGRGSKDFDKIRVVDIVWKSLAKMYEVSFADGTGDVYTDYFTEAYAENPLSGEVARRVVWVPQYWRGKKIGEGNDPIYVDVGPLPYQRRDITDPFEVRSCYVGGFLNDLNGRGYRRPELSNAKPLIHAVNFVMKTIKEREATDIGKVVLMTVAAKPKNWTWGKLMEVVRATKFLPIDTGRSGLTPADVQFFRDIDLSNAYEILPRINYLMFLIQKIGELLGSNAARQGNPAASTAVGTNTQNLNRAYSQSYGRVAWLNKITEHVLENLIYLGRASAQGGNIFMRYALDDLSIANIDIDIDKIAEAYFGVRVSTEEFDLDKIELSRNFLMPFIQKEGLGFRLAMDTLFASSRGEFMHIATEAQMEAEIKAAQTMDFQRMSALEIEQKTRETEEALLTLKHRMKLIEDEQNNEAKKEMAALQSMTIANGNDINRNMENDYMESAREDRMAKREEILIKDSLERDKLALEDSWTKRELDIQSKKVAKMGNKTPTPKRKK